MNAYLSLTSVVITPRVQTYLEGTIAHVIKDTNQPVEATMIIQVRFGAF